MRSRTVLSALFVLAASCSSGGGSGGTQPVSTVATVSVSQDATLVPQATVQLTATPKDATGAALAGQTVTWTTSNSAVASVSSSGLVTALTVGTAIITATSGGKSGTVTMTVVDGGIVGAAGGTVNAIQGAVKLTLPAGALSATTTLTVAPVTAAEPDPRIVPGSMFEIGPSGTQFGAGATMSLAYDPTKVRAIDKQSDLRLFTKNAATGSWAPLNAAGTGSVDTVAHVVTGPLPHLTTFGLASPVAVQGFSSTSILIVSSGQAFTNTLAKLSSVSLVAVTTNSYGQVVGPAGTPQVTSSDATILSVSGVGKATGANLGVAFTLTGVNTGSANIVVTADGRTLNVAVTVTAGPSMSIALSSSSLSTTQGTPATATSTVTITQSFTAPVTLTGVSVSPLNVTGSFTPSLVPAGSSTSSLAIAASAFLSPGAYAFTVTATATPPGTTTPVQATATFTVNVTLTAGSTTLSSADPTRPFIAMWIRPTPASGWTTGTCTNNACPLSYSPSATALTIVIVQQMGTGQYHNRYFNLAGSEVQYLESYLANETRPTTTATWAGTNLTAGYTFTGAIGESKQSATTPSYTLSYNRARLGLQDVLGYTSSSTGLQAFYPRGLTNITAGLALSPQDLGLPGVGPQNATVNFLDPYGLAGTTSITHVLDNTDGSGFTELYSKPFTGTSTTIGFIPPANLSPIRIQGALVQSLNADGSYREVKLFLAAPSNLSLQVGPPVGTITYVQNTPATTLDYSYPLNPLYNLYTKIEQRDVAGNFKGTFITSGLYNAGASSVNIKVSDLPLAYQQLYSLGPFNELDFKATWYGLVGGTPTPSSALGGFALGSTYMVAGSVTYKF
jgi:hypothetical protein